MQGVVGYTGAVGNQGTQGAIGNIILPALTWTALPIVNSNTTAAGGSYAVPQYTITAQGVVHVRGVVNNTKGGTGNSFLLPSGYIPSTTRYVVIVGGPGSDMCVAIGTDGGITFVYPNYSPYSPIFLDGIEFVAN